MLATLMLAAALSNPWLANGDFEQIEGGASANWQVTAKNATVAPDRVRGKWYHFICDVKTGRFDKIHL